MPPTNRQTGLRNWAEDLKCNERHFEGQAHQMRPNRCASKKFMVAHLLLVLLEARLSGGVKACTPGPCLHHDAFRDVFNFVSQKGTSETERRDGRRLAVLDAWLLRGASVCRRPVICLYVCLCFSQHCILPQRRCFPTLPPCLSHLFLCVSQQMPGRFCL